MSSEVRIETKKFTFNDEAIECFVIFMGEEDILANSCRHYPIIIEFKNSTRLRRLTMDSAERRPRFLYLSPNPPCASYHQSSRRADLSITELEFCGIVNRVINSTLPEPTRPSTPKS